jgi:hypothetical protein
MEANHQNQLLSAILAKQAIPAEGHCFPPSITLNRLRRSGAVSVGSGVATASAASSMPRGKPWEFKYLTVNHIYFPLARSSGRILELLRANKAKGGDRRKKLFQFLNLIGTRVLSRHLGRVQEMAEDSADRWEYEARIAKRFGFEQQLELPIPLPAPTQQEATN